jgi:hypothetical protein
LTARQLQVGKTGLIGGISTKMPQSHDTLSGHGLIRGESAQLGFLLVRA